MKRVRRRDARAGPSRDFHQPDLEDDDVDHTDWRDGPFVYMEDDARPATDDGDELHRPNRVWAPTYVDDSDDDTSDSEQVSRDSWIEPDSDEDSDVVVVYPEPEPDVANIEKPSPAQHELDVVTDAVDAFTQGRDMLRSHFWAHRWYQDMREHQRVVAEHMAVNGDQKGVLFWHSTGSGKTKAALYTAVHILDEDEQIRIMHRDVPRRKVIVVTKNNLVEQWSNAIAELPRGLLPNDTTVLGRDGFLKLKPPDAPILIVYDEAHEASSPTTLQSEKLAKLLDTRTVQGRRNRVLLLTATPCSNSCVDTLPDLLAKCTNRGVVTHERQVLATVDGIRTSVSRTMIVPRSKETFVANHCAGAVSYVRLETQRVGKCVYPDVDMHYVYVKLRPQVDRVLNVTPGDAFLSKARKHVDTGVQDGVAYDVPDQPYVSDKVDAFMDMFRVLRHARTIVFAHTVALARHVHREIAAVTERSHLMLAETPSDDKLRMKRDFESTPGSVIVLTRACSEGIDFKEVDAVHVLQPDWNFATRDQVIGRARRLNSHASRTSPATCRVSVYEYTCERIRDYAALTRSSLTLLPYILRLCPPDVTLETARAWLQSLGHNVGHNVQKYLKAWDAANANRSDVHALTELARIGRHLFKDDADAKYEHDQTLKGVTTYLDANADLWADGPVPIENQRAIGYAIAEAGVPHWASRLPSMHEQVDDSQNAIWAVAQEHTVDAVLMGFSYDKAAANEAMLRYVIDESVGPIDLADRYMYAIGDVLDVLDVQNIERFVTLVTDAWPSALTRPHKDAFLRVVVTGLVFGGLRACGVTVAGAADHAYLRTWKRTFPSYTRRVLKRFVGTHAGDLASDFGTRFVEQLLRQQVRADTRQYLGYPLFAIKQDMTTDPFFVELSPSERDDSDQHLITVRDVATALRNSSKSFEDITESVPRHELGTDWQNRLDRLADDPLMANMAVVPLATAYENEGRQLIDASRELKRDMDLLRKTVAGGQRGGNDDGYLFDADTMDLRTNDDDIIQRITSIGRRADAIAKKLQAIQKTVRKAIADRVASVWSPESDRPFVRKVVTRVLSSTADIDDFVDLLYETGDEDDEDESLPQKPLYKWQRDLASKFRNKHHEATRPYPDARVSKASVDFGTKLFGELVDAIRSMTFSNTMARHLLDSLPSTLTPKSRNLAIAWDARPGTASASDIRKVDKNFFANVANLIQDQYELACRDPEAFQTDFLKRCVSTYESKLRTIARDTLRSASRVLRRHGVRVDGTTGVVQLFDELTSRVVDADVHALKVQVADADERKLAARVAHVSGVLRNIYEQHRDFFMHERTQTVIENARTLEGSVAVPNMKPLVALSRDLWGIGSKTRELFDDIASARREFDAIQFHNRGGEYTRRFHALVLATRYVDKLATSGFEETYTKLTPRRNASVMDAVAEFKRTVQTASEVLKDASLAGSDRENDATMTRVSRVTNAVLNWHSVFRIAYAFDAIVKI